MSLKCCSCCAIKPLADFSGNQKRKDDGPRCLNCTHENRPIISSLNDGNAGSNLRCNVCKVRKDPSEFRGQSCKDCLNKKHWREAEKHWREAERANEAARTPSAGACRVRDVQRRYGHLYEIPLEDYYEAGVGSSWNDYVTDKDVQAASDAWDARSIAHDIDTQWGSLPEGGAYSDSNYYDYY